MFIINAFNLPSLNTCQSHGKHFVHDPVHKSNNNTKSNPNGQKFTENYNIYTSYFYFLTLL